MQWLQRLHSFGLSRASFRPKGQIAELRAYVRQRERLIGYAASHIKHMHKALTEIIFNSTRSRRHHRRHRLRLIRAILRRWRACAHYSCHASAETIVNALTGSYRAERLFALEQALAL
ncbi:hypothetical protein [Bradyrhizobium sp. CW7]|uniref:hypothetical protein n=1 Tax=Bradyrhizobium sp. CW7 TaxID=2782688 RepID=UPI001FFA6F97|nr:hypothetical protein [Bradyrhizobium sp. CW7]